MRKSIQKLQLLLVVALLGVSTGMFAQLKCYVLQAPEKLIPGMKKLAIIDFKDRDNASYNYWRRDATRDYGSIMTDVMTADLLEEYRGVSNDDQNYVKVKTNVYTLVERSQLDAIMKEQKLGASGAVSEGDAAQAGKLLGLDVIITGNFSATSTVKSGSQQKSRKNSNGAVVNYTEYWAQRTTVGEASMKIISVETGQVLAFTTKNFTRKSGKSTSTSSKYDAERGVESLEAGKAGALRRLANNLTGYFVPTYQAQDFNFDKPKNKEYKEEGKIAKKALKKGDLKTVYHILKTVHDEDPYDEAITHDLAIVYEAVGLYDKALEYHKMADELSGKKKYARALERCESGIEAINALKAIGVSVTPYDFGEVDNSASAEKVKTKGSKKDRIEVYADANKKSKVVAKVPGSTEFIVLERKGSSWVKIQLLGGKEGFVPASSVK
jgi:tetratricopeptide (TPR) repeat protein